MDWAGYPGNARVTIAVKAIDVDEFENVIVGATAEGDRNWIVRQIRASFFSDLTDPAASMGPVMLLEADVRRLLAELTELNGAQGTKVWLSQPVTISSDAK